MILSAACVVSVIAALAYYYCLRKGSAATRISGWLLVGATFLSVVALGVIGLDAVFFWIFAPSGSTWQDLGALGNDFAKSPFRVGLGTIGLGIGGVATLVPAVLRFVPVIKGPRARQTLAKVALLVAGVFVPLLGVAIGLVLCALGFVDSLVVGLAGWQALLIAAVALLLVTMFFLNVNLTAPHRLYRDGLSKTFVEVDDATETAVPLAGVNPHGFAPYHLINAAANLPTSQSPGLRERKCDFFLFSKHFTGSPLIGYRPTGEWQMNGNDVDLATAMAISGAAVSSSMGLGSIPPLRALLTFLNVRLGFWIRRPDHRPRWPFERVHPGFPSLVREMFGICMDVR